MSFVGVVEGDGELVDTGLAEAGVALSGQEGGVGGDGDERGAVGDSEGAGDVLQVTPKQRLAAGHLRDHGLDFPTDFAEPFGRCELLAFDFAADVTVFAFRVAAVGHLERDTERCPGPIAAEPQSPYRNVPR